MTLQVSKAPATLFAFVALVALSIVTAIPSASRAEDVTCECLESACGACEIEVGTSFYTAKCGPSNSRVKSCKKPTCQAVENQKQCFALLAAPKENQTKVADKADETKRVPASAGQPAGKVDQVAGSAKIERAKGGFEVAKKDMIVYVGDTLVTGEGKIQVTLDDKSIMLVPFNSNVKVESFSVEAEKKRNVVLNLLKGKVRSQVNKTYKDENVFQVRTKTAVAGVRGTDFMASVELTDEQWITAVKTIEGKVRLSGIDKEGEADEHRMVTQGTAAAFVVKNPGREPASEEEFKKIVSGGELSPISYVTEDEIRLIKESTEFKPVEVTASVGTRQVASLESDSVCSEPIGQFNQCSYTCENNPKGEKKCRTDLQSVSCVRRLCRANGLWVEPKRMPASQSDSCDGTKSVVRECGSYW